jgi:hypothetical protein
VVDDHFTDMKIESLLMLQHKNIERTISACGLRKKLKNIPVAEFFHV